MTYKDASVMSKSVVTRERGSQIDSFTVHVPMSFEEKVVPFRVWEIRFLDAINRGLDAEAAYKELGLTEAQGDRLLRSKKAREYLADRARERMAVEGWTADKWMSEGLKVWEGKKADVTREQMEAWKELGARICPKPEKKGVTGEKPVININIGKLAEAEDRQRIIEVSSSGEGTESNPGNIEVRV
jgi:hypothetical protein